MSDRDRKIVAAGGLLLLVPMLVLSVFLVALQVRVTRMEELQARMARTAGMPAARGFPIYASDPMACADAVRGFVYFNEYTRKTRLCAGAWRDIP